ncbi:MAG: ATP-binding protein [Chitinophagaceae bacterium]|nr:ATP-binding protein [Chitinophagaceae bacterium]
MKNTLKLESSLQNSSANKIRSGFLAAFILLLFSNVLTFLTTRKVEEQSKLVSETNQLIHDLDNLVSFMTRTESSFHRFIIDKDTVHLQLFDNNIRKLDSAVELIGGRVSGNAEQKENIENIKQTLIDVVATFQKSIESFRHQGAISDEIVAANRKTTGLMTSLEEKVFHMQEIERHLQDQRSADISGYAGLIKRTNIFSLLVAILVTLYSIVVFNEENRARKKADAAATEFRKQLEKRIEQLGELNTELIDLRSMEKYAAAGRIARTMAHEVRNPLTNINLAIEQLRSEYPVEGDAEMFFEMVKRNSDRINKLVSDLLNSTRLTQLNKQPVHIDDLLKMSLKEAGDRVTLKHIAIKTRFDSNTEIEVDVDKMKIVFLNVIVNAIEAMPDGGELMLTTETQNNKLIIKISDNGAGMNEEQMTKLFEPFFTTKKQGNGLGLANAQNIILNHNGTIKAESELGVGTTFTIIFNLSKA